MRRALLVPALLSLNLAAQTPDAKTVLDQAQMAARSGQKTVLVAFHASWCGWCKRLEGVFQRPAVKAVLDRHFVIQWLTIKERGSKQTLDHPGAAELYRTWTGGVESGIPFCAVLDAKGAVTATSIRALTPGATPGNIGYPGDAQEIQAFIGLLKDGAALTAEECATLTQEFTAAKP